MDKNVKAMLKISDVLDDRYRKLCDRYHDLELSHNRKKKALEVLLLGFSYLIAPRVPGDDFGFVKFNREDILKIIRVIDDALFSDGRVNERSLVKQKKKGGAK